MSDPVPLMPRGVRLHDDRVRGTMVLLAPERAVMLDDAGAAILAEVDGQRSVTAIAARLAERYAAPLAEIEGDVRDFLSDLQAQRILDWADA